jgi:hypothetical protein
MSHPEGLDTAQLKDKLRAIEQRFDREMRARGFDPAQDEHLALTSQLAKLYIEREYLRSKLQTSTDDNPPMDDCTYD